jgi:hypothetical protein
MAEMANICKSICEDYPPAKRINLVSPYLIGNKYCAICEVFLGIDIGILRCPCCGVTLRGHGVNKNR